MLPARGAQMTYEAYGPGGTGFIIEALTDNVNRSAANIKMAITKTGCKVRPRVPRTLAHLPGWLADW
jgi:transcriptional/translational regulatory protein YebC/TACO1